MTTSKKSQLSGNTRQLKAPPPPTKCELAAIPAAPFCISGTIISVDPSIGSASSMPGYAIVEDGKMVDSGILAINPREPHNKRLAGIQVQLRKLVPNPDVLICEAIAPMLSVGGANVIQLHWAVGVILATYPDAVPVLVPNMVWKKHLKLARLEGYFKSDEHDAIALMWTLFSICQVKFKNENDIREEILTPVTVRK